MIKKLIAACVHDYKDKYCKAFCKLGIVLQLTGWMPHLNRGLAVKQNVLIAGYDN
jgi:hypothetical protein